jgi:hypothetical protein
MKNSAGVFFKFLLGSFLFLVVSYTGILPASAADQVFACPNSIIVMNVFTGQAPEGWKGSGEAGPYSFSQAKIINQNQLMCGYVQKYSMAGLYRPWEAGTTCTFANDKKTWNCKDSAGAIKSYSCPASMMIRATAQNKPPDGWQGSGEAGPFPFLNAPAPDSKNNLLRCVYQVPEFNYFLTKTKPAGLCSFDTAKMSWVCRSAPPGSEIPAKPGIGNKQLPGR